MINLCYNFKNILEDKLFTCLWNNVGSNIGSNIGTARWVEIWVGSWNFISRNNGREIQHKIKNNIPNNMMRIGKWEDLNKFEIIVFSNDKTNIKDIIIFRNW